MPASSANLVSSTGTVNLASALLVPAVAARKWLYIQNTDAAGTIALSFANPATLNDNLLGPGQAIKYKPTVPENAIYACADRNGVKVSVQYDAQPGDVHNNLWNPSVLYPPGDQVFYDGVIYTSNALNNAGIVPGTSGAWYNPLGTAHFTGVTFPFAVQARGIAWNGSQYCAVGVGADKSKVATSATGLTGSWTTTDLAALAPNGFSSVSAYAGIFYIVSNDPADNYVIYGSGASWARFVPGGGISWGAFNRLANNDVLVGSNSSSLYYHGIVNPLGIHLTQAGGWKVLRPSYDGSYLLALDIVARTTMNRILTSIVAVQSGASPRGIDDYTTNPAGLWVAVGSGNDVGAVDHYVTTPDGVIFTDQTYPVLVQKGVNSCVASNGDLFLSVLSAGTQALSSATGVTGGWTINNIGVTNDGWQSVCAGGPAGKQFCIAPRTGSHGAVVNFY